MGLLIGMICGAAVAWLAVAIYETTADDIFPEQ